MFIHFLNETSARYKVTSQQLCRWMWLLTENNAAAHVIKTHSAKYFLNCHDLSILHLSVRKFSGGQVSISKFQGMYLCVCSIEKVMYSYKLFLLHIHVRLSYHPTFWGFFFFRFKRLWRKTNTTLAIKIPSFHINIKY